MMLSKVSPDSSPAKASRIPPFSAQAQITWRHPSDSLFSEMERQQQGKRRGSSALEWLQSDAERYQALTAYVQETIKRKECIHFVPKHDPKRKQGDPIKCHCGEVPEKHIKVARGVSEFFQKKTLNELKLFDSDEAKINNDELSFGPLEKWDAAKDISAIPTNAFGKIAFINEGLGGHKPAKYVRLADNTPIDAIMTLLVDHWRMLEPTPAHLVITVIGGAKNFKLDGKKKEIFNHGLINAAQTTSAWIITSGCNMGVMKAVGEAVAEGQTYNWDKLSMTHALRCIGIAPWGYVERREALVSKDGGGLWNANYRVNNVIRHLHPVSLNPDHTHFLLVDDGHRGTYSGVADLRASLERKISLPQEPVNGGESGLGIPVVLVVVEGGYDAILDVRKSLKQRIPVVICEGTGRAADIISYAFSHTTTARNGDRSLKERHKRVLEDKLRTAFGKTWSQRGDEQKETDRFMQIVIECCLDEKLITVFDMNKHGDLDLAILSALLKGQGATNVAQLYDQLKLALTWNRSDVAEDKIFNNQITWPPGHLDDIMTQALIENKVNFVRLLLQNGDVVMHEYLTVPRLRKLYNSAPKSSHLRNLLTHVSTYPVYLLQDVDRLLRRLMSKHIDDQYLNDCDIRAVMLDEDSYTGAPEQLNFPKPFRELFIWAVLMNRIDLARFLWERCDEAIPSAIAASRIYNSLAHQVARYNSDLLNAYNANKTEFEKLAVDVLDQCQNTDPEKAAMLIRRKYPTWGDMNCLQMAAAADDKDFISTVCCQNILNIMWKRGVSKNIYKMMIAMVFFPLVLVFGHTQNQEQDDVNVCSKFLNFYKAPCVKFAGNVMMYLIFLCTYSYMIVVQLGPTISPLEIFVTLWIATFLLEEIREMLFSSKADKLWHRIVDWWEFSFFNRIDLLILIFAVITITLRTFPEYYVEGRTFYAINCVLLFIRLLRDYSASSYLGPKLVMITNMMLELGMYLMIMAVFLLAYGISIHAVMFPNRQPDVNILKEIVYYPFWHISGELYLEELEGTGGDCANAVFVNGTRQTATGHLCPEFNWLVPTLTAGYMLMANVLLLNLLIAIFTHVFEQVETNSIQIWKYGMYYLVVEYDNKPCLAPPFIFFEHIFLMFKWVARRTCCIKKQEEGLYTKRQLDMLQVFEKEMTRTYIRKQQQLLGHSSPETSIIKIMHGVNEVTKLLEEEKLLREKEEEKLLEQQIASRTRTAHHHHPPLNILSSAASASSKPPRFSRWPSLDKLRQLKMLGSIREDHSSDGGGSTVRGYGSETGHESTGDNNTDYNFFTPASKPQHLAKLPVVDGDGGARTADTEELSRPSTAASVRPARSQKPLLAQPPLIPPPTTAESDLSELSAHKLKKRKKKKRKRKEEEHPQAGSEVDGARGHHHQQHTADDSSDDSDSDADVLQRSAKGRGVMAWRRVLQATPSSQQPGIKGSLEAPTSTAATLEERMSALEQRLETSSSAGGLEGARQVEGGGRRQAFEETTSQQSGRGSMFEEGRASAAALEERMSAIEQRLEDFDTSVSQSLYTIETMLRNAVFSRGAAPPLSMPATPSSVDMSVYGATDLYRGAGVLPRHPNTSPPPYRRNFPY